jgi:acetyl esterase/lipase
MDRIRGLPRRRFARARGRASVLPPARAEARSSGSGLTAFQPDIGVPGCVKRMPSWQSRLQALGVRLLVRRRNWGDEQRLTRRARSMFGAPPLYRPMVSRGVQRERCLAAGVQGEWLVPPAPLRGVILYVHGGGFVSCSAATHRPIAAALGRLTSRRTLSIDYRLAPEHRYPAGLNDVLAVCDWLRRSGAPGERLALAGDSAGGNLILSAAMRLRDRGEPPPACIVAFSPWTDLTGSGPSARANDGRDAMFRFENLADFAQVYLGPSSGALREASPLFGNVAGLPPVLFHVGSTELLLDDSRRMHEAIRAAGGMSQLAVFEGATHGWQMLVPFVPEATGSLRAAASFVSSFLETDG